MKLYICYGTFPAPWRPGGHPCRNAYRALREAGHDPELVKSYGLGPLPAALNRSEGRQEVRRLTGNSWVPVLVTDDGEVVQDSKRIVEWAREHPAGAPAASAS
jgi:glutathione S-transferase